MKKILLVITAILSMFFISEPVTADIGLYSYQTNNPDYDDYVSENILSFINNWDPFKSGNNGKIAISKNGISNIICFNSHQANWNYGYIYSFN